MLHRRRDRTELEAPGSDQGPGAGLAQDDRTPAPQARQHPSVRTQPLAGLGATVDSEERRIRSDLRQNSSMVAISSACDHVSGDTDRGAPVLGSSCSESRPPGIWWATTQLMMSRAGFRSCGVLATAMYHCAIQSVLMNHGLPGTLRVSGSTLK